MADDRTPPEEQPEEASASEEQAPAPVDERAGEETPAAEDVPVEAPADEERPQGDPLAADAIGEDAPAVEAEPPAETPAPAAEAEPPAETPAPAAEAEPPAETPAPAADAEPSAAEAPAPAAETPAPAAETPAPAADAAAPAADEDFEEDEVDQTPREKPEIPGADLEVDIVEEGADPLTRGEDDDEEATPGESDDIADQPIAAVTIDLAAGARYRATGKRKTAIARVILVPGTGAYMINGRTLDVFFPRATLQRNIRQPLEAVGYESRMDVIARMQGGGVAAQAGALRHGISRALLEADPNLRGELKRRGFLTRDPRVKERKKAGLKKARKRPQFSKR
jgi:small subunit ribosomal protein S9